MANNTWRIEDWNGEFPAQLDGQDRNGDIYVEVDGDGDISIQHDTYNRECVTVYIPAEQMVELLRRYGYTITRS